MYLNSTDQVVIGQSGSPAYTPAGLTSPTMLTVTSGGWAPDVASVMAFASVNASTTYQNHIRSRTNTSGPAFNDLRFAIANGSGTRADVLTMRGDVRVGIGVSDMAPDGTLHVQTADAAAVPVLLLEQLDVSEEMIEFTSVAGAGNAIEAVGGKSLTTTHWIKVTINGDVRYIPAGTIA